MDAPIIGSGILPNADGFGRLPFNAETVLIEKRETVGQSCVANGSQGKEFDGQHGIKSFLGGMADGFPSWLDGHSFWKQGPDNAPRMTNIKENRAARITALGNAVVPQQVFPILKYIAEIEKERYAIGGDKH